MKIAFKLLLGAAAGAYFIWHLSTLGWSEIAAPLARAGLWSPLILLPYFFVYLVDSLAWSRTLPRAKVSFPHLFKIRWAGESINNVLPSAQIGGEAAKVYLLTHSGVPPAEGAVSAVVSKTLQTAAQLLFILLALAVYVFTHPGEVNAIPLLILVATAAVMAAAILFGIQRAGLFRLLFATLRFFPFKISALEKRRERLIELDKTIFGFYAGHPRAVYQCGSLYLAGWLLDTLEIFLVAWLIGLPITWAQALMVEAFTGIAKGIGSWLPGSLGVQESGIVLVGKVAALPEPLAAVYAIIRRFRELVYAMIGLGIFWFLQNRTRNHSSEQNVSTS